MALEEVGRQLAHLQQEAEIALLDLRRHVRPLKNLHQADHFQVGAERPEDQQAAGGVGRLVLAGAGVRRHQHAVAGDNVGIIHHLVEQPAVLLLFVFAFQQPGVLEVHLVLEGQLVVLGCRPDDAADRCQGGDEAAEELLVELARREVLPRQIGDFRDQGADLPPSVFDFALAEGLGVAAHVTSRVTH